MSIYAHIASFVVQCIPERVQSLSAEIHQPPLTEVTHTSPTGKLVVVVERGQAHDVANLLDELSVRDGVLSVNMVYHQTELVEELEEVISP